VQKYKQTPAANDEDGVDAARASFLLIAQGGGSHANDASKYLTEINSTVMVPPVRKSPPVVKQDLASPKALDDLPCDSNPRCV
jgi:hypothetical protein